MSVCRRVGAALAALLLLIAVSPAPARAVVGGAPETGPLAASTLMILSSGGGACSGVVLAPDVVLTAAHCVTAADDHRAHWRDASGAPVLAEIAAIAVHPGYDATAIEARRRSIDLALVRLAEPLPPPFRAATLLDAKAGAGETLDLLGYGISQEGEAGRLTGGLLRRARLSVVEPYGPSSILVWLAGAGAGGCHGDSGGPIARENVVLAITSWTRGTSGAACGAVSQGVLLGPQRGFVDATLAGWGRGAAWR
ncbi:S1 family peptidase [Salinarimonas chemoclinalis]|uniref:S1 family peptidase n=1 Tax=Salinarimonas chemoclinalis TaxID=3241599 RepID=UPI0035568D65